MYKALRRLFRLSVTNPIGSCAATRAAPRCRQHLAARRHRNSSHALTIFGRRKIFLLSDPSSVRRVLVDDVENFPRSSLRNRLIKPAIGDELVVKAAERPAEQGEILTGLRPKEVDPLARTMAAAAEARVAALARERQEIELPTTIARWTLEVVAKAMLSLEVGDKSRRLKEMSDFYLGRLGRRLPIFSPRGLCDAA